jgi:hypothetical protein
MKPFGLCTALCLLAFPTTTFAGDTGWASGPTAPNTSFFAGLGGSYNSVNFGSQSVYTVGTTNTYSGGVLVDSGMAAGPASIFVPSQTTFAPIAQVGYFQHFIGSDWLWGGKFSYSYLGTTGATQNIIIPQTGAFTAGGVVTPFSGNAIFGSYQTTLNQDMSFMVFGGRSFERGFFYFGAGPTLSEIQTKINGVTGFADINAMHTMITTTPTSFSGSGWIFGGAAQIGATYFLDPTWFLDANYTYSMTGNQKSSYESPFTNAAMTEFGTLSGTSSGKVIAQAVSLSINKTFYLGGR